MTTAEYRKEIVYNYENHDYAMYLDRELIGFARNHAEACDTLNQLVFELRSGQYCADMSPADIANTLRDMAIEITDIQAEMCPCGEAAGDPDLCAPCYAEHVSKLYRQRTPDLDGPVVAGIVAQAAHRCPSVQTMLIDAYHQFVAELATDPRYNAQLTTRSAD